MRISLYANGAVIFVNLVKEEVDRMMELLHFFGHATGLKMNQEKSSVVPTRCVDLLLSEVLQNFGGKLVSFPEFVQLAVMMWAI